MIRARGRTAGSIYFAHPGAFWAGIIACTMGVLLHLPMYVSARHMGYRMAGMQPDATMLFGMALIVLGLGATVYGLLGLGRVPASLQQGAVRVRALDDAKITPTHLGLLLVMALAVTIDVMKPTTLAFVVPGMTREYGLSSPLNPHGHLPAALLPLAGITGTVVGSFLWGWLGDRIGRRASVLLAGVLFATTAICGAMPGFSWNLLMCFLMGIGVGGMLPIMFTLLAETVPARHRGWLMVLIGGDIVGAYIITSWLAGTLVPHYSWRILWLIGLPTGLLLIMLNRWIPESPRYLLAAGRPAEAQVIMVRYRAEIVTEDGEQAPGTAPGRYSRYLELLRPPRSGLTVAVVILGLGIGLMTYGFQLWIPSNLQKLGFTEISADRVLRDAALISFPLNFAAAWLYGFWSSKKTIILLSLLTTLALLGFVVLGNGVVNNHAVLYGLLAVPLWGISSLAAVQATYSAEIYQTRIRASGCGLAAAASKAGGVLIIALVVVAVARPSIAVTALIGAVPIGLAALAVRLFGVETRQRRLEEIATAKEPVPSV